MNTTDISKRDNKRPVSHANGSTRTTNHEL